MLLSGQSLGNSKVFPSKRALNPATNPYLAACTDR